MKRVRLAVAVLLLMGGCALRGIRTAFQIAGPVPPVSDENGAFTAALFQTTGARLQPGHQWQLEFNGDVFDALVADIHGAQSSINFAQYIWEPGAPSDRLLKALSERNPSVVCRILADPMGSPDFSKEVAEKLRAIGCEARLFRPVSLKNLFERNHRKLVIVDGEVGYVGGFGVREEWTSKKKRRRRPFLRGGSRGLGDEWRDDNIRLTGPAVADIQRAFAQNWQEAGGALLPPADFPAIQPEGETRAAFVSSTAGYLTDSERLVHLLVRAARKRVYIANAYFIPDEELIKLLIQKAKEGVDVRVLAPGRHNDVRIAKIGQRRLYHVLLDGGVKIYEYQPVMMHAKTMIIDDRVAMIGSLNLNLISFTRLEEAALVFDDPKLVEELDESWREDLGESREVVQ
jgi:cardiolipin synthase